MVYLSLVVKFYIRNAAIPSVYNIRQFSLDNEARNCSLDHGKLSTLSERASYFIITA